METYISGGRLSSAQAGAMVTIDRKAHASRETTVDGEQPTNVVKGVSGAFRHHYEEAMAAHVAVAGRAGDPRRQGPSTERCCCSFADHLPNSPDCENMEG